MHHNKRLAIPQHIDALAAKLMDIANVDEVNAKVLMSSAIMLCLLKETLLDECFGNTEALETAIERQMARLDHQARKRRLKVVR